MPLYFLPKKVLVKHIHQIIVANFTLCFISLFPLYFNTDHFTIYLVCSFLVPLLTNLAVTFPFKYFFFSPILFYLSTLFYKIEISKLPIEHIYFLFFYSFTMFATTGILSYFNYKNRCLKLMLESKIQKSLEEKSSLVRILTHDISNVLMVLGMNFSIVKKFAQELELHDRVKRCLKILENSISSMEEIVKVVKDMESIEGGKVEFALIPSNIYDIVRDACTFLNDRFQQKSVELIFRPNGLEHIMANVDPSVLRYNILNNILTNALKFSEPNSQVLIDLSLQGDNIVITIEDFGIGIPKELQSIIFDPGKKTTRRGTSGESGTGFGMPLAFSCTNKMKGSLSFESFEKNITAQNHGTKFKIRFKAVNETCTIIAS